LLARHLSVRDRFVEPITSSEDVMAAWPHNDARTESSHPVSRHPLRARECARGSATRLLLVDGHIAFRELLALRLAQEPDFRVVAEASSLAEIRQELRQVAVDVALVELALPDGGGWS
jgi:hypothetical protein